MLETIIVVGIIVIVAVMTGRSFYRTFLISGAGKNDGCGCAGGCQGCAGKDSMDMDR